MSGPREQDWTHRRVWFFPSAQQIWEATGDAVAEATVLAAHPDARRLTKSGCPRCLVGFANLMADPAFACDLCRGTGFPVFTDAEADA